MKKPSRENIILLEEILKDNKVESVRDGIMLKVLKRIKLEEGLE